MHANQTLSEWSNSNRILSPNVSSEPGPWLTSRVPYLREVMDCISDDKTRVVVVMAEPQTGKTEVAINAALATAKNGLPVLYVLPTHEMARGFVKHRLKPANQALRNEVDLSHITCVGATKLARKNDRTLSDDYALVIFDDYDRFPDGELHECVPLKTPKFLVMSAISAPFEIKCSPTHQLYYHQSDARAYFNGKWIPGHADRRMAGFDIPAYLAPWRPGKKPLREFLLDVQYS